MQVVNVQQENWLRISHLDAWSQDDHEDEVWVHNPRDCDSWYDDEMEESGNILQ